MFPTHTHRSKRTALAVGLFIFGLTSSAMAQVDPNCTQPPTSSDIDAAKGLHNAAKNYYAKARYAKAIASWQEAYNFDCTAHRLLINIGNGFEKQGETAKAIEAFETYIARIGANPDPNIVDKVANLRELHARQNAPKPAPKPQPTQQAKPDVAHEESSGPGIAPWLVVGGGAVVAVVGGVLLGIGIGKENDAGDICPDRGAVTSCPQEVVDSGNLGLTMQAAGGVGLGVGGAAVVGGVVWWALANTPGD